MDRFLVQFGVAANGVEPVLDETEERAAGCQEIRVEEHRVVEDDHQGGQGADSVEARKAIVRSCGSVRCGPMAAMRRPAALRFLTCSFFMRVHIASTPFTLVKMSQS